MRRVDITAKNLGLVRIPDRYDYSLWSYLPFSAETPHIRPCSEHSLSSFNRNFMKLAYNMERYKISNAFELRPYRIIHFGVTCPLVPKMTIFELIRSIACLVLI